MCIFIYMLFFFAHVCLPINAHFSLRSKYYFGAGDMAQNVKCSLGSQAALASIAALGKPDAVHTWDLRDQDVQAGDSGVQGLA